MLKDATDLDTGIGTLVSPVITTSEACQVGHLRLDIHVVCLLYDLPADDLQALCFPVIVTMQCMCHIKGKWKRDELVTLMVQFPAPYSTYEHLLSIPQQYRRGTLCCVTQPALTDAWSTVLAFVQPITERDSWAASVLSSCCFHGFLVTVSLMWPSEKG